MLKRKTESLYKLQILTDRKKHRQSKKKNEPKTGSRNLSKKYFVNDFRTKNLFSEKLTKDPICFMYWKIKKN